MRGSLKTHRDITQDHINRSTGHRGADAASVSSRITTGAKAASRSAAGRTSLPSLMKRLLTTLVILTGLIGRH